MLNAAVAAEAYDSQIEQDERMINNWWTSYSKQTWASEWHTLFEGSNDSRAALTWEDKFRPILNKTDVINFYSSGDEVFTLASDPSLLTGVFQVRWWFVIPTGYSLAFGRYSWQKQELFKGTTYNHLFDMGMTEMAGWGFESKVVCSTEENHPAWKVTPLYANPEEANATSKETLRSNPVFSHNPSWLTGTNTIAPMRINEMLGLGIPSLTQATGGRRIDDLDNYQVLQFDLNRAGSTEYNFMPNGWPTEGHSLQDSDKWLHSDLKNVAYYYNFKLYDTIVKEGRLK